MNNRFWIIATVLLLCFLQSACAEPWPPNRHVTLRVTAVNDFGEPVPDAAVKFVAIYRFGGEDQVDVWTLKTDENGTAVFRKRTSNNINIGLEKEGYYPVQRVKLLDHIMNKPYSREPIEEELVLPLRKIQNPIAMNMVDVATEIGEEGVGIGFDMLKKDWVEPHGNGRISDFTVEVIDREVIDSENMHIDALFTFHGEGNGLLTAEEYFPESTFRYSREAPPSNSGYENRFRLRRVIENGVLLDDFPDLEKIYFLRVRGNPDDINDADSAYYGVLTNRFRVSGYGTPGVRLNFTYYLNPVAGDRNLEMDLEASSREHLRLFD